MSGSNTWPLLSVCSEANFRLAPTSRAQLSELPLPHIQAPNSSCKSVARGGDRNFHHHEGVDSSGQCEGVALLETLCKGRTTGEGSYQTPLVHSYLTPQGHPSENSGVGGTGSLPPEAGGEG